MTTITQTACAICEKINAQISKVFTAYHKKKSYVSTKNALSSLTDYELHDIGITRGDVEHIANGGTVYRGKH